jgi:hypothetical protein
LSLNKRKRQPSQGTSEHDVQQSTSTNQLNSTLNTSESAHMSISREERKRLKKIRKDKVRQMEVSGNGDLYAERKHKKKHKCNDELCRHRKHKKRRKHKKHHHEKPVYTNTDDLDNEEQRRLEHLHIVQSSTVQSVSNDSNNNEDDFDFEEYDEDHDNMSHDSASQNGSVTQYEIVQKHEEPKAIKEEKEDTMTSETATESSGSLYVSNRLFLSVYQLLIISFLYLNSNQRNLSRKWRKPINL